MATLQSCRNELAAILTELRSIKEDLSTCAVGIGQENCAASIQKVIEKYEGVQHKLKNVDQNKLADFIIGEEA